eukprot:snap_masked-scaffold_1-processed-gene-9.36-mRNA-1 protein AED:1.00 eAED:1.00 QI:0/0/0/0/1/1/2/0/870
MISPDMLKKATNGLSTSGPPNLARPNQLNRPKRAATSTTQKKKKNSLFEKMHANLNKQFGGPVAAPPPPPEKPKKVQKSDKFTGMHSKLGALFGGTTKKKKEPEKKKPVKKVKIVTRKVESSQGENSDLKILPPNDPQYETYRKMQKIGLAEGQIRHKLIQDGFDPEGFFNPKSAPATPAAPPGLSHQSVAKSVMPANNVSRPESKAGFSDAQMAQLLNLMNINPNQNQSTPGNNQNMMQGNSMQQNNGLQNQNMGMMGVQNNQGMNGINQMQGMMNQNQNQNNFQQQQGFNQVMNSNVQQGQMNNFQNINQGFNGQGNNNLNQNQGFAAQGGNFNQNQNFGVQGNNSFSQNNGFNGQSNNNFNQQMNQNNGFNGQSNNNFNQQMNQNNGMPQNNNQGFNQNQNFNSGQNNNNFSGFNSSNFGNQNNQNFSNQAGNNFNPQQNNNQMMGNSFQHQNQGFNSSNNQFNVNRNQQNNNNNFNYGQQNQRNNFNQKVPGSMRGNNDGQFGGSRNQDRWNGPPPEFGNQNAMLQRQHKEMFQQNVSATLLRKQKANIQERRGFDFPDDPNYFNNYQAPPSFDDFERGPERERFQPTLNREIENFNLGNYESTHNQHEYDNYSHRQGPPPMYQTQTMESYNPRFDDRYSSGPPPPSFHDYDNREPGPPQVLNRNPMRAPSYTEHPPPNRDPYENQYTQAQQQRFYQDYADTYSEDSRKYDFVDMDDTFSTSRSDRYPSAYRDTMSKLRFNTKLPDNNSGYLDTSKSSRHIRNPGRRPPPPPAAGNRSIHDSYSSSLPPPPALTRTASRRGMQSSRSLAGRQRANGTLGRQGSAQPSYWEEQTVPAPPSQSYNKPLPPPPGLPRNQSQWMGGKYDL